MEAYESKGVRKGHVGIAPSLKYSSDRGRGSKGRWRNTIPLFYLKTGRFEGRAYHLLYRYTCI